MKNRSYYQPIILLSILAVFLPRPSCAKLGQDISEFIGKHKELYKLRATTTKDDASHYNFSLLIEDSERQAAPGFGAGCTVTARNRKIVGESMAICLGKDKFMGGQLAGAYGLKFACDAIGRTMPGDKTAQDRELEVFNKTTIEALSGVSKEIRYPGFESKIILSRGEDGNLLIAVVKPDKPHTTATTTSAVKPDKPQTTATTTPVVKPAIAPRASKTTSVAKPFISPLVPPPIVKTAPQSPKKQASSIAAIKNAIKQSTKE